MPTIDRAALLRWLRDHAEHPELLVYAGYTGLATRIERGDFDVKDAPTSKGGIT